MDTRCAMSLVLNAHLPFVRDLRITDNEEYYSAEEDWFFESLGETYLPLLGLFDRLEKDHIHFRITIVFSPLFCQMLRDEYLLNKFLVYTERQIEFGKKEMEKTANDPQLNNLAKLFFDEACARKTFFTERCAGQPLDVFADYCRKGRIEIMTSPATNAFLPFLASFPESVQAQIEVALDSCTAHFGMHPQGFWLPELGWTAGLETSLRSFNFIYTVVDTHGVVFGKPHPKRGSFYPVKTPSGIFILSRDFYAGKELEQMPGYHQAAPYRDNSRDVGYELSTEELSPLTGSNGVRIRTGLKYWAHSLAYSLAGTDAAHTQAAEAAVTDGAGSLANNVYNPKTAADQAAAHAKAFLDARVDRLTQVTQHMSEVPLSLCACDADAFGRYWYEGTQFLETLFRLCAARNDIKFLTPSEYICKQDVSAIETSTPEFSSSGFNGYAETWLDSSNDWIYRHLFRAQERMAELAQRFPDDSGLKERALNQACRELLLAQASDWAKLLYKQESADYARTQIEDALRNFTTIYESLGSGYISTEWLTKLEKRHNVFPNINYRIFKKKRQNPV